MLELLKRMMNSEDLLHIFRAGTINFPTCSFLCLHFYVCSGEKKRVPGVFESSIEAALAHDEYALM